MINAINAKEIDEEKIINQIRCLGIDMIHEANSGHPGIVLGAAPAIYALYAHHLKFDPKNPNYFNRDRFVMSAGHGSALLYATLYMAGFDLTLDDLKAFRQLGSKTPGHPEVGVTPGVDCTTGPLGQGFATAVGMAIAEAQLREKYKVIDHYTYVLCGDGDLMEGISYEAASIAGNLKLNKLIVLYDSNNVCLDGPTKDSFKENVAMRFISQGWNVISVEDGNAYELISKAITQAKSSTDKPTLIEINSTIGKYSELEGTSKVHGSPLKEEDITKIKEKMGVRDIFFQVSQQSLEEFRYIINDRCENLSEKFEEALTKMPVAEKEELEFFMNPNKKVDFKNYIYDAPEDNMESPRDTSKKVLNGIVPNTPYMLGGAADTFGPNKTYIENGGNFTPENRLGKNIYYGVREHAMGAITNGLALSGYRPYCSTFLAFSDYLRPTLRMASLMNLPNIYVFTHDSISVGEDGPTHQPVEQLLGLRSLPNFDVFRPADANEVIGSYKAIFAKEEGPATILLSRNKLPILEYTKASDVEKGGYVLLDTMTKPDAIVISSGEEIHQVLEAAKNLRTKGVNIRVVSMPNLGRFMKQDEEYKEMVLPVEVRKIVVETSNSMSWNQLIFYDKYLITLNDFGASGKYKDVYEKYGFDAKSIEEKIENLLK
ncbi:MAG: transketolase [Bacilli bacterium]|nr:transketolase [Bacilli bacterium]MBR6137417.1 transketolase [Bacilli bacterium]